MLSPDEFQDHLQQFIATSDVLEDGWFIDTIRNQTFARNRSVVTVPLTEYDSDHAPTGDRDGDKSDALPGVDQQLHSKDVLVENSIEEDDCSCMPSSTMTSRILTYEYHILYSESYAVPVLYLNILNSSGQRIGLDEVWGLCPETFQPYLQDNKWTTLTQQEHPLLGTPYLMLHPCHTADLMSQVTQGSGSQVKVKSNYLVTWLSSMGPLVGLKLSEQYAKLLKVGEEQDVGTSTGLY